ncbi:shikimate dehydrogenase [Virgibacillus profundi]|uniref:Shikimate dehydrogenase (NADP(+)) n=1 Tax=Virgibacillus profundi TaxID=2024555 RepID=A0A2A2IAG7_9BACI|nr:shikimate dehydrogenase [Virgibacillus profundi]PAV28991.1 shikimate dehydrogenase [Virgibacillus profundi]PXY53159.1 shikimate dehydrogenase [Virgibacillus profundi]
MANHFALIGYPIKHSLSPWIHEQFLKKTNLEGTYTIHEIPLTDSFEDHVKKLKETRINGFNVTVPYKQEIIPFLDEIDGMASKMGAVNTVANKDGKWIGYNTDGIGYLRSLESKFPALFLNMQKRVLVIGAGGAARGIFCALDSAGFKYIDITNRTARSAQEIAELRSSDTNTAILTLKEAEDNIKDYDVIIQTTSVGMKPTVDASIINLDHVRQDSIVSDIIYQPIKTKLLQQAETSGASVHFGHTMLIYQAQYAFEIWTNKKSPIDDMDLKLQLILEGR